MSLLLPLTRMIYHSVRYKNKHNNKNHDQPNTEHKRHKNYY